MDTLEILDAVKKSHGLTTDTELANLLECSTAQISQYRTKKRTMDDYTASRVADLLGLDPMALIAQANAEREKNEEKREYWKRKAECFLNRGAYACSIAVIALVTNFVTPSPAQAAPLTQSGNDVICIMLNRLIQRLVKIKRQLFRPRPGLIENLLKPLTPFFIAGGFQP